MGAEDGFDATNCVEVAKLASDAARAFKKSNAHNEVSHLMKPAMTGVKDIDLNIPQQRYCTLALSVSEVPPHMANQMQGKDDKIGKGSKIVQFRYKNSQFGPIYVNTEEEIKAIVALIQFKIEEREYRD